jgi:tRNA-2-methylthio-N6-dimethylallyladenosine synthase
MTPKPATYYLETFGCQMNVLDSQLVEGQLRALGLRPIDSVHAADVVLFNTCSVRQHAEDKVLSRLGMLKSHKRRRPHAVIGVIGCMAEREKEGVFEKAPHVDLLCGPGELNRLPGLLTEVWERHERVAALAGSLSRRTEVVQRALEYDSLEALDLSRAPGPGESVLQSYIRVQRGCDKFCTYCVVPFTRGPERSRPPAHIVEEARKLADQGCREITLLGQTVNSYVHQEDGRPVRFARLLERVHDQAPQIDRIRFVTSFPADWEEDIFRVMRDCPRISPYLHIPAQSGSDAVLRRMRRTYTIAGYLRLMDTARKYVPGVALAGDFIVGFCGETDADFAASVELARRVEYKNTFVFKYSPRPGTAADRNMADDVPEDVKNERCNELLAVHAEIAKRNMQRHVGRTVEVLVEGYSRSARRAKGEPKSVIRARQVAGVAAHRRTSADTPRPTGARMGAGTTGSAGSTLPPRFPETEAGLAVPQESEQDRGVEVSKHRSNQLVGRTRRDDLVVFDAAPDLAGSIVEVLVDDATPHTLIGHVSHVISPPRVVTNERSAAPGSGVRLPVLESRG